MNSPLSSVITACIFGKSRHAKNFVGRTADKLSTNIAPYNWEAPHTSRNIFGGWRMLKNAIKEGAFQRWKSRNELLDPPSDGLWTELHRPSPLKTQIPHEKELVDKLFGTHVGIWFVIGEPFAKGGFGEVRYGYHKSMSTKRFAVKVESVNHTGIRHLSAEYNIYSVLGDAPGLPRCYYYGLCGIAHNALVMDLLGPSLDDIFEQMKRKFTVRTVALIALQTLDRLNFLHTRGVVHGDVKGENFLTGLPNEGLDNVIYIVDFGLSQVLKDHAKGVFLYHENTIVCPSGTPRYMSVSAHNGNALSYRDDLESLAYVLVYFMKGRLPWQGIHERDTSKKSAIIKERKSEEPPESICADLPDVFPTLLKYSRSLKFQEEPDYLYLKQIFNDLLQAALIEDAPHVGFDWIGKTFHDRKEPIKHPILPRAEFQKKTSVPYLVPNEKLRLLQNQQKSAHQLSIMLKSPSNKKRPLNHSPSTPYFSPSQMNKAAEIAEVPLPRRSPSVPHLLLEQGKVDEAADQEVPSIRILNSDADFLKFRAVVQSAIKASPSTEPQPEDRNLANRRESSQRTRKISEFPSPPTPTGLVVDSPVHFAATLITEVAEQTTESPLSMSSSMLTPPTDSVKTGDQSVLRETGETVSTIADPPSDVSARRSPNIVTKVSPKQVENQGNNSPKMITKMALPAPEDAPAAVETASSPKEKASRHIRFESNAKRSEATERKHRNSVLDQKMDESPQVNGTCFGWLKRRARCGGAHPVHASGATRTSRKGGKDA